MSRYFIKIIFILLTGSTCLMADNDFYMKVDLLHKESSKDSNTQRYTVEINNTSVRYQYHYNGYPDNRHHSKKYLLSEKELSEIIREIKEKKINHSVEEIISTKANGAKKSVDLSLFLSLEGKITESKISGNTRIFRADGKIKGEIIQNINYVDNVASLIQDIER